MSFWTEPFSLLLLTVSLLCVAEGNLKTNCRPTKAQPFLPKRQPGRIHSSLSVGKQRKRKLNVDNSKKLHGGKWRKDNNTYQDKAVKKKQRVFKGKRKWNVNIQDKPIHWKKLHRMNDSKTSKHSKPTRKRQRIFQGKRKSQIDIQGEQAISPVMYTSQNGQDQYLTVRTNQHPHGTPLIPQQSQGTQINPNLPSKTFLVTVYGDQIEGAEERLRDALAEQQPKKCPCKCDSTPCKQTEEACPCDETADEAQANQAVSLQAGGPKLILFPNAGRPFGREGCICPCCLCSCSEPGHENYKCGCQNSPPVPCPCSSAMNASIQPLTSSVGSNSSPVYPGTSAVATGNQVASWTGGTSSCPCSCCPCACAQPQRYPNYQCGCASQSPSPCPCNNQGWNFDQSGAENNIARSSENSPYTALAPTGDYQFESSCDCYCCPCSCPGTEYSAYDNSQCTCGQDNQAACTCRRSEVRNMN